MHRKKSNADHRQCHENGFYAHASSIFYFFILKTNLSSDGQCLNDNAAQKPCYL